MDFACRYVAQGKGILQPHVLIDELDNVIGEDEAKQHLRDGPLSEILKVTQVDSPSLIYFLLVYDFHVMTEKLIYEASAFFIYLLL